MSPEEVLSNLERQVEAGHVLYIETNGVGCYADPRYPPSRSGKLMGRKPTQQSKTGDLVGKVVLAVREIVEHKKKVDQTKKNNLIAQQAASVSTQLFPGSKLSASALSSNGNNNRNVMATMKDILLHVQRSSSCVVKEEGSEAEGITPSLLKAAVKRAVMRGFLNETGKYYSIDNSKEFSLKGRKKRHSLDGTSVHDLSHLLIEDGDSSDSSLSDASFLSSSLITSPPLLGAASSLHVTHTILPTGRAVLPATASHNKSSFSTPSKADQNTSRKMLADTPRTPKSPKKLNSSSKKGSSPEKQVSVGPIATIHSIHAHGNR